MSPLLALLVAAQALAAPFFQCEGPVRGTELAVGADVLSQWGEAAGPGFDLLVTWPALPCTRVGLREHVAIEWWGGVEAHHEVQVKSHLALGTEVHLPVDLTVGTYLLPGVRTVLLTQRVDYEERGLEGRYGVVNHLPSLYNTWVVRWRPVARFGVHAEVAVPLADREREVGWYRNRLIGLGVDLRLGRVGG